MFLNIKVKPAADLSRLEEVLVVTEKQEREPAVAESGGKVRAADILAARLPSVPDKPPAPAAGATSDTAARDSAGDNVASAVGTHRSPAAGQQPASGEVLQKDVLKKVVQKTASAGSAGNGAQGGGSNATLNPTLTPAPNSANPPAKPATAQPKPASAQSNPQPAATEDNPH